MSDIFKVDLKDVAGAVVSAVIVAVLGYLSTLANITDISFSQLLNITILTAITSLLKSFTTDKSGKMLGAIKVK